LAVPADAATTLKPNFIVSLAWREERARSHFRFTPRLIEGLSLEKVQVPNGCSNR
jgi:hypothetical protein